MNYRTLLRVFGRIQCQFGSYTDSSLQLLDQEVFLNVLHHCFGNFLVTVLNKLKFDFL